MPLTVIMTSANGVATLDMGQESGLAWDLTLAQDSVAITIINPPAQDQADVYVLLRQQDGGGQVATWTNTINWDSTPPQPTADNPILVHLITLDGDSWFESPTEDAGSGSPAIQTAGLLTVNEYCICPFNGVMPPAGTEYAALVGVCTSVPYPFSASSPLNAVNGPQYTVYGVPTTPEGQYISLIAEIVVADVAGDNMATLVLIVQTLVEAGNPGSQDTMIAGNAPYDTQDFNVVSGSDLTYDEGTNTISTTAGGVYVVQAGWALGWESA